MRDTGDEPRRGNPAARAFFSSLLEYSIQRQPEVLLVELVRTLMRIFSYFYHGLLALFLFAISLIAAASDSHTIQLEMLPWKGQTLTWVLLGASVFAFASLLLAARGVLKALFFAWSLAVVLFLVKGYVFSGYKFEGGEFRTGVVVLAGSLAAAAGAWFELRRPDKRRSY